MKITASGDALEIFGHWRARGAHPLQKITKGRPPRKVLLSLRGTICQWLLSPMAWDGKD
jgi:hypothetical protein